MRQAQQYLVPLSYNSALLRFCGLTYTHEAPHAHAPPVGPDPHLSLQVGQVVLGCQLGQQGGLEGGGLMELQCMVAQLVTRQICTFPDEIF